MTEPVDKNRIAADFDHRDDESSYSPWSRWARLREEAPIAWSEKYDGFFILSRYKDIFDAARDPQTFSSALKTVNIPPLPAADQAPIMYDPPEHDGYRTIVNPLFSPAKVAEYEPWIREIANRYIEPLLKRDAFNVVTDLAMPVTNDVTLRVLGITDPPAELKEWSEDLSLQRGDPALAAQRLMAFLSAEIDKRKAAPGDDAISALINAKYADRGPLTHHEMTNMALLMVLAGLDTTTSAIGGSVWHLIQTPDAQKTLATADERGWRLALDEFIRWVSPLAGLARTVRDDTEFKGCPMHGGDRVLLLWASGNRDETEFPDPDKVILDRFPNRHMGFGMGIHRCLGSHLAKAILRAVLEGLLAELGNFRLKVPDEIVWVAAEVRGIRSLPLVRK